jgi:hypothetical protein
LVLNQHVARPLLLRARLRELRLICSFGGPHLLRGLVQLGLLLSVDLGLLCSVLGSFFLGFGLAAALFGVAPGLLFRGLLRSLRELVLLLLLFFRALRLVTQLGGDALGVGLGGALGGAAQAGVGAGVDESTSTGAGTPACAVAFGASVRPTRPVAGSGARLDCENAGGGGATDSLSCSGERNGSFSRGSWFVTPVDPSPSRIGVIITTSSVRFFCAALLRNR